MINFFTQLATSKNIEQTIELTQYQLSDNAGYSWFSRTRVLSKDGYTYIGVVADFGTGYKSGLIRINETDNTFTEIPLSSDTEEDDHNETAIIFSSVSNKYIAAYCEHHTAAILRYRTSDDGLNWGAEQTINTSSQGLATYSTLYEDASGNIYYVARLFTNAGGYVGGWWYLKSTDGGLTFGSPVLFYDMAADALYPIIYQDTINKDILHIAATEFPGLDQNVTYNGVYYGYMNLSTGATNDGQGNVDVLPLDTTKMHTIVTVNKPDEFWIEDLAVNQSGYPRILYTKLLDYHNDYGLQKERWYVEWNGSTWSTPYSMGVFQDTWSEIPSTGTNIQPNVFTDPLNIVTAPTYSNVGRFNDRNVNQMFLHKMPNAGEKTELFLVTRNSSTSFTWQQLTFNSTNHQWRANSIPSGPYSLYWINARDYRDMKNFDQDIYLGIIS